MKRHITHLFSILLLVSLSIQAMDVSNRKALKPLNNEIQWCLHNAAKNNHIQRVRLLIKGGADVNDQSCGRTPLHRAVIKGHAEVAQQLLKAGADVNKQDLDGFTPLHHAAEKGYVALVRQLLKGGADVNKQDVFENTPLHSAVYEGHVAVVQQLLKRCADVDKQDTDGWTPLYDAAYRGFVEVVQQFIKGGAAGLNMLHKLVRNKFPLQADKRAKLIKLVVYNKPVLARLKNTQEKTPLQCAVDLDQHLMDLLQDPKQYISKHPERFTFIQDIDYNILKKTTSESDLFYRIRNRELGMPFYARLKTNKSLRATANNSSQKEKLEAAS